MAKQKHDIGYQKRVKNELLNRSRPRKKKSKANTEYGENYRN